MSPLPAAVRFANPIQALTNDINRIIGPQNIRALFIPHPSDGPVSQDRAVPSRFWTHNALPAGSRYTKQGQLWALSFDTTQRLTSPDADDMSPGNGTVDGPWSIFTGINVTDTAVTRFLLGKNGLSANEWTFQVTNTDKLAFEVIDQSVPITPNRISNAAIIQGSWTTLGVTYSAASGPGSGTTTADMTLYQGGAVLPSTGAGDSALYIAMENGNRIVEIGAEVGAGEFAGQLVVMLAVAAALSAAQQLALHNTLSRYGAF